MIADRGASSEIVRSTAGLSSGITSILAGGDAAVASRTQSVAESANENNWGQHLLRVVGAGASTLLPEEVALLAGGGMAVSTVANHDSSLENVFYDPNFYPSMWDPTLDADVTAAISNLSTKIKDGVTSYFSPSGEFDRSISLASITDHRSFAQNQISVDYKSGSIGLYQVAGGDAGFKIPSYSETASASNILASVNEADRVSPGVFEKKRGDHKKQKANKPKQQVVVAAGGAPNPGDFEPEKNSKKKVEKTQKERQIVKYEKKFKLNRGNPSHKKILDNLEVKADTFIGKYSRGSIRREFPGEYLDKTISEILQDAAKHNTKARTAKKLLIQIRFGK